MVSVLVSHAKDPRCGSRQIVFLCWLCSFHNNPGLVLGLYVCIRGAASLVCGTCLTQVRKTHVPLRGRSIVCFYPLIHTIIHIFRGWPLLLWFLCFLGTCTGTTVICWQPSVIVDCARITPSFRCRNSFKISIWIGRSWKLTNILIFDWTSSDKSYNNIL